MVREFSLPISLQQVGAPSASASRRGEVLADAKAARCFLLTVKRFYY
jgi:hypothetical protein